MPEEVKIAGSLIDLGIGAVSFFFAFSILYVLVNKIINYATKTLERQEKQHIEERARWQDAYVAQSEKTTEALVALKEVISAANHNGQ